MVSVTERVKTLFLSPLQPGDAGGGWGGGWGGGCRGGAPLFSRPPHLRQPFQLTPTPSPAPPQETFQNDEKLAVFGSGPSRSGAGPQAPGARAPSRWGPGPKPLWARAPSLHGAAQP